MFDVPPGAAARALAHWPADPGSLAHVATSGNAVYRFTRDGVPHILRLTHPAHRSAAETEAELAFLEHLRASGVRANVPVASRSGRRVEIVDGVSACVLTWVPGLAVAPDSEHWNETFFREWGASLARIHAAARTYRGLPRWDWRDEGLIADADDLFPEDDTPVRAEFARVMRALEEVPRSRATYGMIHADFAPANFQYVPGEGIHAFDFGNCCTHWFASDLAISLSVLRRRPDRDRLREWLLAGYRDAGPPDAAAPGPLELLIQLRILYVLLSRLRGFGPHPNEAQRATLETLRTAVLERFAWPMRTTA
jgi:Ser/Thr protein kinase RdoA (MazF antagonist)